MKKISLVMIVVLLVTVLSACSLDSSVSTFNGSRTGNGTQFIMTYTAFNTTDSQALDVKAGDTIHAEIVVDGGHLSYKIQKDNEELIAEGKGIFASEEFDVKVDESGTYRVTVIGEKAKGSVKFVVKRTE